MRFFIVVVALLLDPTAVLLLPAAIHRGTNDPEPNQGSGGAKNQDFGTH
jgi:hypothetical protein